MRKCVSVDVDSIAKMRCSKVRVGVALVIFSAFVVAQFFLLRLRKRESTGWSLWPEEKPLESWISGIKGKDEKVVFSRPYRIQSLKQGCGRSEKSWDSLSVAEQRILAKHVIVNDEHRFLFCSVPKVACSNWKRVFMVLEGAATDSNTIRKVNHLAFTYLADLPPMAIKQRLKEYYKFMFVREPLERLASAYKDKFMLNNTSFHKSYGRKIIKKIRKNAGINSKGNDVTLTEFLQYITESRFEDMNEHWMPYHVLCRPCAVLYDFVGSFENLEADATHVLKDLNINEQVSFPKQQKYYKAGGNGFVGDIPKYTDVPAKVLENVLHKYATDYKLFSYPKPSV